MEVTDNDWIEALTFSSASGAVTKRNQSAVSDISIDTFSQENESRCLKKDEFLIPKSCQIRHQKDRGSSGIHTKHGSCDIHAREGGAR